MSRIHKKHLIAHVLLHFSHKRHIIIFLLFQVNAKVKPINGGNSSSSNSSNTSSGAISKNYRSYTCSVCVTIKIADKFYNVSCGHSYCKDCWSSHFEIQINQGISTLIGCMAPKCDIRVPEDFVLTLLNRPLLRDKYQQFAFQDYVKSHPELRFCPGPNCQVCTLIFIR